MRLAEEGLANQFRFTLSAVIERIARSYRAGDIEDPNLLLRQQAIEAGADRFDTIGKPAVQGQYNLVLAAVACDRHRKGQRITSDAPLMTVSLSTLQIDNKTH